MRLSTTTMKRLHGVIDTKSESVVHADGYETATMGCDGCAVCCSGDCHRGMTCDPDGDIERWKRKSWRSLQET